MSENEPEAPNKAASTAGCLLIFVVMGAVGFNALFCEAGTVNEMEGSGLRALIGGCLGLVFGCLIVLDD